MSPDAVSLPFIELSSVGSSKRGVETVRILIGAPLTEICSIIRGILHEEMERTRGRAWQRARRPAHRIKYRFLQA
jgi:hypothetical protein